ncbi:helix-turn-helix domain-containing protein [Streptomyces sp. LN325]|uniref:helix-turn-helix domain-containing protein n=1 Tax=Streptomyces sp. LN325 TaxID=3112976 RepID=UPI003719C62E
MGDVLRRERLAQERTLKDVADAARISMPYLSELERGRKEASSEVLAAAARALGLGLTDLLSLAQDELTRLAQVRPARRRTPSSPRHDGMCLAADARQTLAAGRFRPSRAVGSAPRRPFRTPPLRAP